MSTHAQVTMKCAVCGHVSEQFVITSTNTFGAPDLDLRPPEMQRSTMNMWVHECPECGYAAADIENADGVDKEWIASEEYVSCGGLNFKSHLAELFYREYIISMNRGKLLRAADVVLRAAWACDDAKDTENAAACRRLSVDATDKFLAENEPENRESILVQRADVLRRCGRFDDVINEYSPDDFSEDILKDIVRFQIERAKAKDTACYTTSVVFE